MHQHEPAIDRAVGEHGPVGGDPGNAQARPEFVAQVLGQRHRQILGYDGVLGGGAEGPVGLGAVHPHPPTDPACVDTVAHRVDDTGRVTVRDHPGIGHGRAEPATPFLGVAGIDTRHGHPDADLAGTGLRIGQFTDPKHLDSGTLSLVPGRKHGQPSLAPPAPSARPGRSSVRVPADRRLIDRQRQQLLARGADLNRRVHGGAYGKSSKTTPRWSAWRNEDSDGSRQSERPTTWKPSGPRPTLPC